MISSFYLNIKMGIPGWIILWLVKIYLHSKCFFFIYNVRSIFYVRNVKVPKKMLQVYQYVTIRVQSDKPILAYILAVFSLSLSLSQISCTTCQQFLNLIRSIRIVR